MRGALLFLIQRHIVIVQCICICDRHQAVSLKDVKENSAHVR